MPVGAVVSLRVVSCCQFHDTLTRAGRFETWGGSAPTYHVLLSIGSSLCSGVPVRPPSFVLRVFRYLSRLSPAVGWHVVGKLMPELIAPSFGRDSSPSHYRAPTPQSRPNP